MLLELLKTEEIETDGPKTWYKVVVNGITKHFLVEQEARNYYAMVKDFHLKHGKTEPVTETLLSEEIPNA
jgi:hypothetical protein